MGGDGGWGPNATPEPGRTVAQTCESERAVSSPQSLRPKQSRPAGRMQPQSRFSSRSNNPAALSSEHEGATQDGPCLVGGQWVRSQMQPGADPPEPPNQPGGSRPRRAQPGDADPGPQPNTQDAAAGHREVQGRDIGKARRRARTLGPARKGAIPDHPKRTTRVKKHQ